MNKFPKGKSGEVTGINSLNFCERRLVIMWCWGVPAVTLEWCHCVVAQGSLLVFMKAQAAIMSQIWPLSPPVSRIVHKNPFSTPLWTLRYHELISKTVNPVNINRFYATNIHFVVRQLLHQCLPIHSLRRNHWAYSVVILKLNMAYIFIYIFLTVPKYPSRRLHKLFGEKIVFQSKPNIAFC